MSITLDDYTRLLLAFRVLGSGGTLEKARATLEIPALFKEIYDNYDNAESLIERLNEAYTPSEELITYFTYFGIYENGRFVYNFDSDLPRIGYQFGEKLVVGKLKKRAAFNIFIYALKEVAEELVEPATPFNTTNDAIKNNVFPIFNDLLVNNTNIIGTLQEFRIFDPGQNTFIFLENDEDKPIFYRRYTMCYDYINLKYIIKEEEEAEALYIDFLRKDEPLIQENDIDYALKLRANERNLAKLQTREGDVEIDLLLFNIIFERLGKFTEYSPSRASEFKTLAKALGYWNEKDDTLVVGWEKQEMGNNYPSKLDDWKRDKSSDTYLIPVQNGKLLEVWKVYELNKLRSFMIALYNFLSNKDGAMLLYSNVLSIYSNTKTTNKMFYQFQKQDDEPRYMIPDDSETLKNLRNARNLLFARINRLPEKPSKKWFDGITEFSDITFAIRSINREQLSEDQLNMLTYAGALVGAYNPLTQQWITSVRAVSYPLSATTTANMKRHSEWFHYMYQKSLNSEELVNFLNAWSIFANIVILTLHDAAQNSSTLKLSSYDPSNNLSDYKPLVDNLELLLTRGGDNYDKISKLAISYDYFKDDETFAVGLHNFDNSGLKIGENWLADALQGKPKSVAIGTKHYNLLEIASDLENLNGDVDIDDDVNVLYIYPILDAYNSIGDNQYLNVEQLSKIGALGKGLTSGGIKDEDYHNCGEDLRVLAKWASFAKLLHHIKNSDTVSDKVCRILESEI